MNNSFSLHRNDIIKMTIELKLRAASNYTCVRTGDRLSARFVFRARPKYFKSAPLAAPFLVTRAAGKSGRRKSRIAYKQAAYSKQNSARNHHRLHTIVEFQLMILGDACYAK